MLFLLEVPKTLYLSHFLKNISGFHQSIMEIRKNYMERQLL